MQGWGALDIAHIYCSDKTKHIEFCTVIWLIVWKLADSQTLFCILGIKLFASACPMFVASAEHVIRVLCRMD